MRFLKRLLSAVLALALLLAVPCAVLALEEGADEEVFIAQEEAQDEAQEETSEAPSFMPGLAAEEEASPQAPTDEPEAWRILENGIVLAPAEDVSMYPVIRYGGAMNGLYHNPDPNLPEEEWEVAFSNKSYSNFDNLWPVVKDAFLAFCMLDYKRVAKVISDFLWEAFEYARMDEKGDPVYSEVTMSPWNTYGWQCDDGKYYFCTDWREDPVVSAERLRTFIIELCERLGCDKVNLIGVSGNGNSVLAYLKEYKTDMLASVFFNYSLHGGSSTYGDFATMNVGISPHAAGNMSPNKMEDIFIEPDYLEILIRGLYEVGVWDFAAKIFKFNFDRVKQDIYDNAAVPLLFTNPHIWSYIPPAQYEKAKALLLKDDPKYNALVERIDYYQYEIMRKQNELLMEAAKEIKVAVRAGYNRPLYAYTAGAAVHADDKVDTQFASFGATCAPLNYTFPLCYKQKVDSKFDYISPDRMIDASTCAIPELTWFGKNQPHLEAGTRDYNDWYGWFLGTEEDYTVHGNPEHPQYMEYIGGSVYVPLVNERSQAEEVMATVGLWALKAWRWVLLLPLFWI